MEPEEMTKTVKAKPTIIALLILIFVLMAFLIFESTIGEDGAYKQGYLCRFKYAKYIEPTLDQNSTGFGLGKTVTEKCDLTAKWFRKRGLGLSASDKFINVNDLEINNGS